jgi:hypothetical protein
MTMAFRMMRAVIAIGLVGWLPATPWAQSPTTRTPPPRADEGVAARQAANPDANQQATALAEFQKRLQDYIRLRADLGRKLKPLATTASSAELAAEQDTLAAALREARKGAKPGDMIPSRVADQIRRAIAADFQRRDADAKRALFQEVPGNVRPAVNQTMPDDTALVTMPALLLRTLPPLPDNLQYRFMGRHVILMDGDTRIIIDYILSAVPLR